MAGASRQLLGLFGQALRAVGIVVLLATVYPPLIVVPLLALAPAYSDRVAARFQQRAEDELALDRRLPRVEDHDAVRDALARSDAAALEHELPDGLLTRVGTGVYGRAGSLGRPLAAARPGARVDAHESAARDPRRADRQPRRRHRERTVQPLRRRRPRTRRRSGHHHLLVSHRFSTARSADLIVVLDRGQVAEAGTHEQLMRAAGAYAALFELQARAYA